MRAWHIDDRKFWGWGDPEIVFDDTDRPQLWPYIREELGVENPHKLSIPTENDIHIPSPIVNQDFLNELNSIVEPTQIKMDHSTRLRHSYGQSYRDLLRLRKGHIEGSPDAVVYPKNHEQSLQLLAAAQKHNVCCIPFGGGSNIFRMLEREPSESRMLISIDTKSMSKLLSIDKDSRTATFQAGVFGPDLEAQLQPHGMELGHRPDSFHLSTLGGWIATRSAGMFSNDRGKIEDMVLALKLATPNGTIQTRLTPAAACGPEFKQMLMGSEGVFGVITEATVRVRPIPEQRRFEAVLFPDFETGIHTIQQFIKAETLPPLVRLMDEKQMRLVSCLSHTLTTKEKWLKRGIGWYLRSWKGFDPNKQCLMFLGFEGSSERVHRERRKTLSICKQNQAFPVGPSPANKWYREVYDFGYFRDFVYQYGIMGDATESCTVWSNLMPLYLHVRNATQNTFAELGVKGYVGCHISHVYETGSSLYFIFVCPELKDQELEQHRLIRTRMSQAIQEAGGSLSHHHSIGRELQPFLKNEHGEQLLKSLQAFKNQIDPEQILNPGNLIPKI